MPVYEYECPKCGTFEFEQRMSEAPLSSCPSCDKRGEQSSVKRLISSTSFQLKGGGWYKTDYSSNGSKSKSASSAASPAESTETKAVSDSSEKKSPSTAPSCGAGCGCKES